MTASRSARQGERLEVYERSAPIVREVWRRLDERLTGYPGRIGRLGAAFLKSIGGDGERYFSGPRATPLLHLPIWMARNVPERRLFSVLEATALAYFYARIQDDVLDEPLGRGRPLWLLLGNCLIWDAAEVFFACSESTAYRRACRRALGEFSRATAVEQELVLRHGARYAMSSFVRHSGKAALAEIPLYAVAALQGDFSRARHVAPLVRTLGEAYGLTNDIQGFRRDIAHGHRTFLVAALSRRVAPSKRRDAAALEKALFESDLVERALGRAIRLHERARPSAEALGMRAFTDYSEQRAGYLRRLSGEVSLARLAHAVSRID